MLSEADIVTVIMGFAAQCGDPKPTAIRYARGTRGELDRAIGG
jgi:cyclophilin family peptidyl-prolyl cis-trans isomerase